MSQTSTGQTVGYIRVSSLDQNTDRQLDGQKLDRTLPTAYPAKTQPDPNSTP
jgi:hypothetical protein